MNVPLVDLLGGAIRDEVPFSAYCSSNTPSMPIRLTNRTVGARR
jgi:L-alanine-DL-glutamate epimerase-like enolase superfamily enzyme